MPTIKDQITTLLDEKLKDTREGVRNPDRRHNSGPVLFEIAYWQEISDLADKRLKQSWTAAEENGVLKSDDYYRQTPGETIAAESEKFSCLMKVSSPRKTIDKEAFIAAVAKKCRIAAAAIEDFWEANLKEGKASLSKKILEV